MLETTTQKIINKQLFEKLELAYFCVDHSMVVKDVSSNLSEYGFTDICKGGNIEDCVDFMVGLDSHTEIDLPLVASPSGIPISVSLLPSEEQLTVVISNASTQAEHRQMLQQKANENELLVYRQKKLMAELERASTELEFKNKQLEEASRLQTSFLSGVSHEFRTPLTSIIGYTKLVRKDLQQVSEQMVPRILKTQDSQSYLSAVQRSSKHLLSLVENLLDHGKLDSNEIVIRPKRTDIAEVFEDARILLHPLSATKNIEFDVDINFTKPAFAVTDDSRLRQCLINIIGNAIKFTDQGLVKVSVNWVSDLLTVSVQDTGPGISQEDLEKIRLPFWQAADTGKAGTGLGLTITERLIEMMGGELSIDSQLGGGTHVRFSLPMPVAPEGETNLDHSSDPEFALKLLLVEDDSDIADLVCMMLNERGIDVTHVGNGALALDALCEEKFDIVLMDIHMPVMSGYDAIKELRTRGDKTPIVVMSASAMEADREKAELLGCQAYLVKPVDVDDILGIADAVLSR